MEKTLQDPKSDNERLININIIKQNMQFISSTFIFLSNVTLMENRHMKFDIKIRHENQGQH